MFISSTNDKGKGEEETAGFIIPAGASRNITVEPTETILPKIDFSKEIEAMQMEKTEEILFNLHNTIEKKKFDLEIKTKIKPEFDIFKENKDQLKIKNDPIFSNKKSSFSVEAKLKVFEKNTLAIKLDPLFPIEQKQKDIGLDVLWRLSPSEFSFSRNTSFTKSNAKDGLVISVNQRPSNGLNLPLELGLDEHLGYGTYRIDRYLKDLYGDYVSIKGIPLMDKFFILPVLKFQKQFWNNSFFIGNIFKSWYDPNIKNADSAYFKNFNGLGLGLFFGKSFDFLFFKKLGFVIDFLGIFRDVNVNIFNTNEKKKLETLLFEEGKVKGVYEKINSLFESNLKGLFSEVHIALFRAKILSLSLQMKPNLFYTDKFDWNSSFEIKIATWLSGIVDSILPGLTNKFFDILDLGFDFSIDIQKWYKKNSLDNKLDLLIKFMMATLTISKEYSGTWKFSLKFEIDQKKHFSF